ncbi:MAG TPA: hypothetical protein VGM86_08935 [Thermoanaerobaculia bacterium]|jgi:hypothetical protein
MPKLSYAQEIAALEEALAALRSMADVMPPLALALGEELAAQIVEIKALKARQRAYVAERMAVTEALHAAYARGMADARWIRACAVLVHGPKSGRLVQFGIRPRRRPRRKAASPAAVAANPFGPGEVVSAAAPDAAWTAHAGRANVAAIGGEADRVGGDAAGFGGNAASDWAAAPPDGAFPACGGASASADGGNAPKIRGNAQAVGANVPADPETVARAA